MAPESTAQLETFCLCYQWVGPALFPGLKPLSLVLCMNPLFGDANLNTVKRYECVYFEFAGGGAQDGQNGQRSSGTHVLGVKKDSEWKRVFF